MKRILVLSGGGAKGAIQLDPLIALEKKYNAQISEVFDLVVGTSVGAINAGAMASGQYSAWEYKKIFLDLLPRIFKKKFFSFIPPKYDKKIFRKEWSKFFNDYKMYECRTKFICSAVNICNSRDTHYFKSWERNERNGYLKLSDAIVRSFSAPYYFGAEVDEKEKVVWVDGGTGIANMPVNIAYIEACRQGWFKDDPEGVKITCIGCGYHYDIKSFHKVKKYGAVRQILNGYMNPEEGGLARSQALNSSVNMLKAIEEEDGKFILEYYNVSLSRKIDAMDKIKYVNRYLQKGGGLAKKILN